MLLIGVREEGGWLLSRWETVYGMGWESILRAAEAASAELAGFEILRDGEPVEAQSAKEIGKIPEAGSLTIRGMSQSLSHPVMLRFWNQTQVAELLTPTDDAEMKTADYESFNKFFCAFLDSVEIAMQSR